MINYNNLDNLFEIPPYALNQHEKQELFLTRLRQLSLLHYNNCTYYQNIINRVFGGATSFNFEHLEDVPFLPVSLFKTQELRSIPSNEIFKVLTSSSTTGQTVSKIYLDRETSRVQSKVLVKIAQHYLGKERLPMVILDHQAVIRNRQSYSARGAGILGMATFGVRPFYALREDMLLDLEGLTEYLKEAKNSKIFFFGFTFMVWQYLVLVLEKLGVNLDIKEGILIHSGGWKKLQEMAVQQDEFRHRLEAVTGIKNSINFYGMVEQVGSVFFENSLHYLHASNYSDLIIRDPITLKPLPDGAVGLVQVVSILPTSYPGHSILTEDLGVIHGVDNPATGMYGRYFEILGRVPKSELRGCSDTFQPSKAR